MMGWKIKTDWDLNRKCYNSLNLSGKRRFLKKQYIRKSRRLAKLELKV